MECFRVRRNEEVGPDGVKGLMRKKCVFQVECRRFSEILVFSPFCGMFFSLILFFSSFFFRIFFVPIFSLYIHFVFVFLCQFKIFLHMVLYLILLLLCAAITIGIFINFITIYIFFPDLQFIFEKIIFLSFSVFVSRSNMSSLAFYIMHSRKETVVRKIFSFCSFSLFFLYCYDFTQFRLSTLIALLLVES